MRRIVALTMMLFAMPVAAEPDEPAHNGERTAADVESSPLPGNESGRTDKSEGDSLLRNIAQGVLLPPRVAVEVAMAPVRASIWTFDRFQLMDRFKQVFFDDTETYGLYPTAVLDSSYGLTLGGRFIHRDLFGEHEHLSLRGGSGGEYRAQAEVRLRSGTRLGDRVNLELKGELERRPQDAFYGIGNAAEPAETHHRQELVRATTVLDIRAISALHVQASGAVTDLAYGPSSVGPSIETMYDPMSLTGWTGTRNLYGELELRWDRRHYASTLDDHATWAAGWLLGVYGGRVHQLEAGTDYWRYGGEAQHFLQLGAGPRVLASRFHAEAVTGEIEDVAFTQLPQLGGKMLLRGYPRDRFRDRAALVGSLEYEWDLGRLLMASLFVDAGRVFPNLREIEPSVMRVGYGFSIQLHSHRRFLASVSIASSIDGGVFIDFAFDPVFDIEPRVEQR
jgi:hypothetical protein